MDIKVTKKSLGAAAKMVAVGLFVLAGIFSLASSISYLRYRTQLNQLLGVVQFDINSRADEIRAKFAEAQAAQSKQPQIPTAPGASESTQPPVPNN